MTTSLSFKGLYEDTTHQAKLKECFRSADALMYTLKEMINNARKLESCGSSFIDNEVLSPKISQLENSMRIWKESKKEVMTNQSDETMALEDLL